MNGEDTVFKEDNKNAKKGQRFVKARESARLSRKRRKNYVENLEIKTKRLEEEAEALRSGLKQSKEKEKV
jgi:hypothetical protein